MLFGRLMRMPAWPPARRCRSSMNPHCQACIATACKGDAAAAAPRAAAPLPVPGIHGRATTCVSAFAFQVRLASKQGIPPLWLLSALQFTE